MDRINVNRAIASAETTSRTHSQTTTEPQSSDEFTPHERDVTGYAFLRLKAMHGGQFDLAWATEKEVNLAKREFAHDLGKYSREQIDQALKFARTQMANGDKNYFRPNVMVLVRDLACLNTSKKMYQTSAPKLPPPIRLKRKAEEAHKATISGLRDFLNDDD